MALNKTELKDDIVTLLTDMMTRETDSVEEYATRLADAIDKYVKSAKINYTTGLVAGSNPVTGVFNGQLS